MSRHHLYRALAAHFTAGVRGEGLFHFPLPHLPISWGARHPPESWERTTGSAAFPGTPPLCGQTPHWASNQPLQGSEQREEKGCSLNRGVASPSDGETGCGFSVFIWIPQGLSSIYVKSKMI